jgi:peptide-methionine (S)-S-oxide reductase
MALATFGGGCFWCTEAVLELLDGVTAIVPGYAGGHVTDPTYEEVCAKTTGHAEVVQVTFDPAKLSYKELLAAFFLSHDPTTLNRQGNDVGPQYRSIILAHDDEQMEVAKTAIAEMTEANLFGKPIVTEVVPYTHFYEAEKYHHGYYRNNTSQGYCSAVINPKVAKFRKQFAAKLRQV